MGVQTQSLTAYPLSQSTILLVDPNTMHGYVWLGGLDSKVYLDGNKRSKHLERITPTVHIALYSII